MDIQNFSQVIVQLREKLGISQEELASRLGVAFTTVNRWENEKSEPRGKAKRAILELIEQEGLTDAEENIAGKRPLKAVKKDVLSTKSMEQMLWSAACSVRGEKDAPKFKDYILPLIFIKRLSDVFDDEVVRLAEEYGDEELALTMIDDDHYRSEGDVKMVRFYIPAEARWDVVSGRKSFDWPEGRKPKSLGEQLTMSVRAIVRENKKLAGVIDLVDYNETRNGEREISDQALSGIIETLSDPRYRLGLYDVEPDFLGRAYEYLLRKFAEGHANWRSRSVNGKSASRSSFTGRN
ncbi:MAG: type I restriction-modification system subunit M N-terminal domain-containing protein [Pontiellaceae bacterium]|nr:type I restriction-modification system subunit M N-terminal domain-containing protein [Pontiellaceae bacterium]